MPGSRVDRYDEMRRAWIAAHQGVWTIQRRRAEQLGRRVRARQRHIASAVPDPHDDTLLPPLWLRTAQSPASQLEVVGVLALALVLPLGWLAGRIFHATLTRQIPGTLRAYPIPAMLWSGVVLGAPIVVLSCWVVSLRDGALTAWLCAQLAATPAVAGVYGIADGWLAVPGSTQWWPLTPAQRPLNSAEAAQILGGYDINGPGVIDAQALNEVGERSRP
ncbi:hypothetical protein [Mycobacterium sp. GA-2829]|uniref:hypothetical protein n=1 Tax=Mycobacterium sp. GA-2829 TaxID=1772283 RepID=UPI00073FD425|nr:hypothetical protein [Mycobacterium sp. GA-2829]KUI36194.1 hypothetical protein AU194_15870 [Mycobacterium sp. GA-2829]